jgi:hypothetical protein
LEQVTKERSEVQGRLDALRAAASPPRLPTVDEIAAYVLDVEARLKDDPTTAREALRRVLIDGKIVLHPQPDGTWLAESLLIVGRLAGSRTRKPRNGGPSGASENSATSSTEVVEIGSCAGPLHDFPDREEDDFPDCWAPFEGRITVGWE